MNDDAFFREWFKGVEDADAAAAMRELADELVFEYAEIYLDTAKGITSLMTNGMSRADVLRLAIEEGFDYDAAQVDALAELGDMDDELDDDDDEAGDEAAAGVFIAEAGNESPDGPAPEALDGGAGS